MEKNIIYFLCLDKNIPDTFVRLAEEFNSLNIKLIPVTAREFNDIVEGKQPHLIVLADSIAKYKTLRKAANNVLGFSIKSRAIAFHEVSSFEPSVKFFGASWAKNYHFYKLPVSLETLVADISVKFYGDKNKADVWPGGRRVRVPSL